MVVTETGPGVKFATTVYVRGDAARNETDMGSFVVIVDAEQRQMSHLFSGTKAAIRTPLAEVEKNTEAVAKDVGGPVNVLPGLKGGEGRRPAGRDGGRPPARGVHDQGPHAERVEGHRGRHRVDRPEDRVAGPSGIELRTGDVRTTAIATFLGFNEVLDPKLIDLTAPEGYTVTDVKAAEKK